MLSLAHFFERQLRLGRALLQPVITPALRPQNAPRSTLHATSFWRGLIGKRTNHIFCGRSPKKNFQRRYFLLADIRNRKYESLRRNSAYRLPKKKTVRGSALWGSSI